MSEISYGLSSIVNILKANAYEKVFVLCDSNSNSFCLSELKKIASISDDAVLTIQPGESFKTLETVQLIWTFLQSHHASRKSVLLNLGGGVIGDMGGFAASCFNRGISFINIPTTVLAMVDASVGGKTGVNFLNVKNQVGSFNHPDAVILDTSFLKTLSEVEFKSGFAEIVKHALVSDANLWNELKITDPLDVDASVIRKAVSVKLLITKSDPLEKQERKLLNFGHTIGHAIESCMLSNNNIMPHGYAVAAGMIAESYISHDTGSLSLAELHEISAFLIANFELEPIKVIDPEELMNFVYHDKKNENNQILTTLLTKIGKGSYNNAVSADMIRDGFGYLKSLL